MFISSSKISGEIFITIETEGSHFLPTDYPINLLSISPKFSNSVPVVGAITTQGAFEDEKKVNKQNQLVIENLISEGEVLAQTDSPKLITKFKLVSLPNSEGIELKAKFSDLDPESLFSINKKIEFVNDFRGLISGELVVKFNYLQWSSSVDLSIESNNGYMDLNSFEKVSFNYRSAK